MEERRTERRTRVLLPARILTNGRASLACSIRDLTEGGARLHVPAPEQVPERFDLVIDQDGPVLLHGQAPFWPDDQRSVRGF